MKEDDYRRIVEKAIEKSFMKYGFTTATPNEVQQDIIYLRKLRLGGEAVKRNIVRSIIGVTIPAFLYVVWQAIAR